jgi:hypothetical protein
MAHKEENQIKTTEQWFKENLARYKNDPDFIIEGIEIVKGEYQAMIETLNELQAIVSIYKQKQSSS